MPESCCVPFCKSKRNYKVKKEERIRFFEIPANLERREKWLNNIRRRDWMPNDRAKVCEKHFLEDDFQQGLKVSRLKPSAVPTVFQDYPSYLQKQLAKKLTRKPPTIRQPLLPKRSTQKPELRNNDHRDTLFVLQDQASLSQGTQTVVSQCLPDFGGLSRSAVNDLKAKYRKCRRKISYLKTKSDALHLKVTVLKDALEKNDKESMVQQVTRIKSDAAKGIPAAVFLLEQLRHYGSKRPNWERKMLQYCVTWRAKSEQGYSFIRNSQLLKLPDRGTLRRHVESERKQTDICTTSITVQDLSTLDHIAEPVATFSQLGHTAISPHTEQTFSQSELTFMNEQECAMSIEVVSSNSGSLNSR